LTVDGTRGGSNLWAGIRALNVSGAAINGDTVQNVISAPANVNIGIQLGSAYFGVPASGNVNGNTVTNYAGAGVFVDGTNAPANEALSVVSGNTITGRAEGNKINGQVFPEYGVQVSNNAFARVTGNTITLNTTTHTGNGHNSPLSAGVFYYNVNITASTNISGNHLTNNDDGILIQGSNGTSTAFLTISGNTVTGSFGYAGIDVISSNYTQIMGNTVSNNTSLNGIALTNCQHVLVGDGKSGDANTITSNNGNATDGVYDFQGANNTIGYNTIYGNSGNGINLDHSTADTVSNNTLFSGSTFNTLYGISLTATTNSTGTGNTYGATPRKYTQDSASTGNTINQS
jgi:parallel beta-helix repeat protein